MTVSLKPFAPLLVIAGLFGVAPAEAQFEKDWKGWYGQAGMGYLLPQGDTGDAIDEDLWFAGGVSYYPEPWPVGIALELSYSNHDIKDDALEPIQPPGSRIDGDVTFWSLTANAVWSPRLGSSAGFYAVAGFGAYRVENRLSEPGHYTGTGCDPWLWWCVPGIVAGEVVPASESTTELGFNLGIGVAFEVGQSSEVYLEVRYHSVDTPETTELLPLVIGYRW
ncbi:MAG TPA: outer membrane beta-barrel protein [Thermoanaerobaculales bacterium]|nr:outer membrane beta-barrel protein [Thermoanaerobaculales bacterium]HQP43037.1 outer membrane beta-barrel protein [Thermoanaerobaculales bacterium]